MAKKSDRLVAAIGAFKLFKSALLVALGIAGLVADPGELAHRARHAVGWLGWAPGRHVLARVLGKLGSVDEDLAHKLAVASLCYAAVFLVEAVGLLARRRWAEWLTVIVTASFIPIEIYELVEHFSAGKVAALILNLAISIYLLLRRLEARRGVGHRLEQLLGH